MTWPLIRPFGTTDGLAQLTPTVQVQYLRDYLADLGAETVVEEPEYFDRDYLAEHAAFYSSSVRGYVNHCRRLHFFSRGISRATFTKAIGGSERIRKSLQETYLGFCVVRPIERTPLGRTVLRWYPERLANPRITTPSRPYTVHLAGMPLTVEGLAWQQQDSGVSACATVALWSMLHSSAFHETRALPTTVEVTRAAHGDGSASINRLFPSKGLNAFQMCQAIRNSGLAPIVATGDLADGAAFSRPRFAALVASALRSGYPALIGGCLQNDDGTRPLHAVCAVGFRDAGVSHVAPNTIELQDAWIEHIYIHDDNIGANVRFQIADGLLGENAATANVILVRDPPAPLTTRPPMETTPHPSFRPSYVVVAVEDGLRTSMDAIHMAALDTTSLVLAYMDAVGIDDGLTLSTRFMVGAEYLESELPLSGATNKTIASARIALASNRPPLCLHLGIGRVGWNGQRLFDLIYDTTDTDPNLRVLATVAYGPMIATMLEEMCDMGLVEGKLVRCF